jgi:hypothetical protein
MATVRLRYVGPIDEIDLPLIHASLKQGDEFDGPAVLLEQRGNYELADKPKTTSTRKKD